MVSKEDIETAITSTSLEAGMLDDKPNENNIIDWDGPQDPENPHNWPERKRWAHVIVVALISLVMYVQSSP